MAACTSPLLPTRWMRPLQDFVLAVAAMAVNAIETVWLGASDR